MFHSRFILAMVALALSFATPRMAPADDTTMDAIRKSLTFWAGFETGADADFAKGDARLYHASSTARKDAKPGLPGSDFKLAPRMGYNGGNALQFVKKSNTVLFYQADKNVDYRNKDWSGTVSFWLMLDLQSDLGDWFCDPIQITDKAWDNAALWVDFSKDDKPKHFRLGSFANTNAWNPLKKNFDKMPADEKPMITVTKTPFAKTAWTHVAFTFDRFNTGKNDGSATLYLNGKKQGTLSGKNQLFTWDMQKTAIQIGIAYVGYFDDLSIYNRALTEAEIQALDNFRGRLVVSK
ncbi:MAG: LamG domain-containing protein [Gemmataceae bacterium]